MSSNLTASAEDCLAILFLLPPLSFGTNLSSSVLHGIFDFEMLQRTKSGKRGWKQPFTGLDPVPSALI